MPIDGTGHAAARPRNILTTTSLQKWGDCLGRALMLGGRSLDATLDRGGGQRSESRLRARLA